MRFEGVPGEREEDARDLHRHRHRADEVVVDGNHPLAGERLWFKCTVTDVRAATEEELTHGHVHGDYGVHRTKPGGTTFQSVGSKRKTRDRRVHVTFTHPTNGLPCTSRRVMP
jgi:hypothetical protein